MPGVCLYDESDMFFAKFHNLDEYSIDIIKYDERWNQNLIKSRLDPNDEYSHEAYFAQNFLFKRSDTKDRLKASANGVTSEVFEGCRYRADAGRLILVNILGGNKLFNISWIHFLGIIQY